MAFSPRSATATASSCTTLKRVDGSQRELERFTFPRQREGRMLCISDFFMTREEAERRGLRSDVIALSLVTVGARASEETKKLFEAGDYTRYLYLHGLSVETAEALAEYTHKIIREKLGIASDDSPRIPISFIKSIADRATASDILPAPTSRTSGNSSGCSIPRTSTSLSATHFILSRNNQPLLSSFTIRGRNILWPELPGCYVVRR